MFRFFESLLKPTAAPPAETPPRNLAKFYWFFLSQAKGLFVALFLAGLAVAFCDSLLPVFMGRLIDMVSRHAPAEIWPGAAWQLAGMALVVLVVRPSATLLQNLVTNQAIAVNMTNLIRWQSHWHVVRQSWSFFQNDFAGRIANRVIQTGAALRESVVSAINAVWYIAVYGTSALILLASTDVRLALPLVLWLAAYATLLRTFVPRLREQSKKVSEARSLLTGRIVDSYTNILTVKLFARPHDEDDYAREAVDDHTYEFSRQLRLTKIGRAHV
mgnify:FL=1